VWRVTIWASIQSNSDYIGRANTTTNITTTSNICVNA
jgi:hypothetical protein